MSPRNTYELVASETTGNPVQLWIRSEKERDIGAVIDDVWVLLEDVADAFGLEFTRVDETTIQVSVPAGG